MQIKDLVNLVSFQIFYETCRTKLNNTLVKYHDEWCYCTIADGPFYTEDKKFAYGSGKFWITLSGIPSKKGTDLRLNTLDDIETEIAWPDMGYYFWQGHTYQLTYPTTNVYKAGLAPQQLSLRSLHPNMPEIKGMELTGFLNHDFGGNEFPTLLEASSMLTNTINRQIPVSRHSLLEAHPYVDNPVVTYGSIPVGESKAGVLHLSPSNKPLGEYFTHVGVPFTHEII